MYYLVFIYEMKILQLTKIRNYILKEKTSTYSD